MEESTFIQKYRLPKADDQRPISQDGGVAYRGGHVGVGALLEEGQGVPVGPEARGKVQRAVAAVLLDDRVNERERESERRRASESATDGGGSKARPPTANRMILRYMSHAMS